MSNIFTPTASRKSEAMSKFRSYMADWMFRSEATIFDPETIRGKIAAYDLVRWWSESIPPVEQRKIFCAEAERIEAFMEFETQWSEHMKGWFQGTMVVGRAEGNRASAWSFLGIEATSLNERNARWVAQAFMRQALSIVDEQGVSDRQVIELHFLLHRAIELFYSSREADPNAIPATMDICRRMIDLSPRAAKQWGAPRQPLPSHKGFEQLAIIHAARGEWEKAIEVSEAASQAGWAGDWDTRIGRYRLGKR